MASPRPDSSGNPYLSQLGDSLAPGCSVQFFSWRRAILGRYDVFHIHWPETLFRADDPLKTALKTLLAFTLIARLAVSHVKVVSTVHNIQPHERANEIQALGLRLLGRMTAAEIRLIPMPSRSPDGRQVRVIPHGHYRDSYRALAPLAAPTKHILFFGNIRPYKGVDKLIDAFAAAEDPSLTLEIAGLPVDESTRLDVETRASTDPRIGVELRRLAPDDLAERIERATLVILPFTEFLNSGSALLALSLGRPVLMPASPAAEALRGECGSEWVLTFDGLLTGKDVADAYAATVRNLPLTLPPFEGRDWKSVAEAHVAVYTELRDG